MFLSYLIEISLLWLLLEATAPAFQRRILRDFFPGLPRGRGRCRRTRTLSTRTQPSVGPARAGSSAALAAPRPPRAPGVRSKQTARPAKASLTQTRTSLGERALSALNSDH